MTAAAAVRVVPRGSLMLQTPCHAVLHDVSLAQPPARGQPGLMDQSEQTGCVTLTARHAGQWLDLIATNPMQPRQ